MADGSAAKNRGRFSLSPTLVRLGAHFVFFTLGREKRLTSDSWASLRKMARLGARAFFDKTPWGVSFQRWTRRKKAKAKAKAGGRKDGKVRCVGFGAC